MRNWKIFSELIKCIARDEFKLLNHKRDFCFDLKLLNHEILNTYIYIYICNLFKKLSPVTIFKKSSYGLSVDNDEWQFFSKHDSIKKIRFEKTHDAPLTLWCILLFASIWLFCNFFIREIFVLVFYNKVLVFFIYWYFKIKNSLFTIFIVNVSEQKRPA